LDNEIYKNEREKLRKAILCQISYEEVLNMSNIVIPYLDNEQAYDFTMLATSKKAIELVNKHFSAQIMDFTLNSLVGIEKIILLYKVVLDFDNHCFKENVADADGFKELKEFLLIATEEHKNKRLSQQELFDQFIKEIAHVLGAYVGECLINSVDEGYWDFNKLYHIRPPQLSIMTLKRNNHNIEMKPNPVGKVYKSFFNDEDNVFLGMHMLLASWDKLEEEHK